MRMRGGNRDSTTARGCGSVLLAAARRAWAAQNKAHAVSLRYTLRQSNRRGAKGNEMKMNAIRWGLVTFASCISCGIVGHYLPIGIAHFVVVVLALFFGIIGTFSVSEQNEN
jgi:hypothetical protein